MGDDYTQHHTNMIWEIYTVANEYALPGKHVLAYRPNGWLPYSSHMIKFMGFVEAPTANLAIQKWSKSPQNRTNMIQEAYNK